MNQPGQKGLEDVSGPANSEYEAGFTQDRWRLTWSNMSSTDCGTETRSRWKTQGAQAAGSNP